MAGLNADMVLQRIQFSHAQTFVKCGIAFVAIPVLNEQQLTNALCLAADRLEELESSMKNEPPQT